MSTPSKRPASRELTPPLAPSARLSTPPDTDPRINQILYSTQTWLHQTRLELISALCAGMTYEILQSSATTDSKTDSLDKTRRPMLDLVNRIDSKARLAKLPLHASCVRLCPRNAPRRDASTQAEPPVEHISLVEKPRPVTAEAPTSVMDMDPAPVLETPRPTYAEAAVSTRDHAAKLNAEPKPGPNPRHPPTFKIPPASRPKTQPAKPTVLNPVRLVVRPMSALFQQVPFAPLLVAGPAEPFRLLSHALSLSPTTAGVVLLGVHQNRSKNLIISLPHGTSDAHVDAVSTIVNSTYRPLCGFPLSVSRDVAWSKFMVSSVPARLKSGEPTFSEEEVQASFPLNPAVKSLHIMRPPRWIRNPAAITGAHSSFTFSFQDPDGSLGRSLAKSRLFVFGEPRFTSNAGPTNPGAPATRIQTRRPFGLATGTRTLLWYNCSLWGNPLNHAVLNLRPLSPVPA
ncbi:hypothetical protein RhiJN_25821 [Ceratobasidium sp. AG-Ba]|nr:hypothetical protein RhiJN_25821 [Ceratobasidium sp. AG-Ba]